jgi:NADPH2:quinone reductase
LSGSSPRARTPVDAKFRAAGGSRGLEAPIILGADVSGVVEEVGPGVTDLTPGDEVYYTPEVWGPRSNGGYAEYHVTKAGITARKPPSLSPEEAAGVPLAGGTAYEAIVRRLGVRVGETVLIHGGAGGVGSFAIQIVSSAGARVLANAGPANQETLQALGADVAIDYTRQDAAEAALDDTGGAGVDVVLDAVGGEAVMNSIPATRPFGRLATILGAQGDLTPLYQKNQTLHGVRLSPARARTARGGGAPDRERPGPPADRPGSGPARGRRGTREAGLRPRAWQDRAPRRGGLETLDVLLEIPRGQLEDGLDLRVAAGEAAERLQLRHVDAPVLVQLVANVEANHPADDQMVGAEREDPVQQALQVHPASSTREAATTPQGAGVRPALWNSSASGGWFLDDPYIVFESSRETMLITNSPVSSILSRVSLVSKEPLHPGTQAYAEHRRVAVGSILQKVPLTTKPSSVGITSSRSIR